MKNITGSPVEGDDFFGREKELEFAWKHIQKGNSLILAAPRRVGKSSFAKKLLSKAKKEKWYSLEINLEEITSEEAFINLFIEKLEQQSWWSKIKKKSSNGLDQILSSIKATVEHEGIKGTLEWQSKKENIYEKLKQLLDHGEPTLIMVDEVTISNTEDDWMRFAAVVSKLGFGNWLLSILEENGYHIILSPYFTAIKAINEKNEEGYLNSWAVEIREPARKIVEMIKRFMS